MILPVAQGDVSLGQHEMVEGVLNVDLHVTVAQYVASVYTTTPLASRANAVYRPSPMCGGVVSLANPIENIEGVSAGALPDLSTGLEAAWRAAPTMTRLLRWLRRRR